MTPDTHSNKMDFTSDEVLKSVKKLSTAKGKQVTAKNSYEFYYSAITVCFTSVTEKYLSIELNKRELSKASNNNKKS